MRTVDGAKIAENLRWTINDACQISPTKLSRRRRENASKRIRTRRRRRRQATRRRVEIKKVEAKRKRMATRKVKTKKHPTNGNLTKTQAQAKRIEKKVNRIEQWKDASTHIIFEVSR